MRVNRRSIALISFDLMCFAIINIAYYIASLFTETHMHVDDIIKYVVGAGILLVSVFAARLTFRVYFTIWRYTSTHIYLRMVLTEMLAVILAFVIAVATDFCLDPWYFVSVGSLDALMVLSSRFCYRLFYKNRSARRHEINSKPKVRVAIVGAGQMGVYLSQELRSNPNSKYLPVCFVDTDTAKGGKKISGIPVCTPETFSAKIEKFEVSDVIIAIASIDNMEGEEMKRFHDFYNKLGCKVKIYDVPLQYDNALADGENKRVVRDFRIEDLLFRKQMTINDSKTKEYYRGRTVLVTGGGGSIGSEICRQIAKCAPKKLIIFDIYENNAYEIQQQLVRKYGDSLDLTVLIGSVRDRRRLEYVFDTYRPDVVFHAAAHKHVPLMENSGCEAIKNNVLGTYNTADMAEKYGVSKFVLISTDKAVNPTNIMGASKRLCEMVIQCRIDSNTSFAAVRFGNVLGSNGSVIPLFRQQIANGGPVTITDKRIIRYFMTIPEASQLVIEAGAMAKKGELFVLDMGKPVRIYDLAENMIKLSGLVPHVDIKIEEIGLRPGEKLYEELLMKTETLAKTTNDKIFIETDAPMSREEVEHKLDMLISAVDDFELRADNEAIHRVMRAAVPTFHDPEELNRTAESSEEMQMSAKA